MSNGKHSHAWTVAIVAVCLLFTQLATAAYVCPRLGNASNPVVNEVVTTMVDCDSMPNGQLDMDQPGLCKAHCQTVQQSHESKNKFNVEAQYVILFSNLDCGATSRKPFALSRQPSLPSIA